jgi:hypothetical protein
MKYNSPQFEVRLFLCRTVCTQYAVYAHIQTVQPETFFKVVFMYVEEAQGTRKGLHSYACRVKNKMANNIYGKDAQPTLYSTLNT